MLLLMGRHPGMLIPDDVDASDYEVICCLTMDERKLSPQQSVNKPGSF